MGLLSFLGKVKSFIGRAVAVVKQYVPEQIQQAAVDYVKDAALLNLTNTEKRERVVRLLVQRFPSVPESVIRLAVELAVNIVKKELA